MTRASIVAELSEAHATNEKQTSKLSSVGPKTPKIDQNFMIQTTFGDRVIKADKTSEAF